MKETDRRTFLKKSAIACSMAFSPYALFQESSSKVLERTIPSSGEKIPVVGMGSWLTFDVGSSKTRRAQMKKVLAAFSREGGRVVDSSPMYGSSERTIGSLMRELELQNLWIATKVWTNGESSGKKQIADSKQFFEGNIQLHQIHNLRDFRVHYATLRELKENDQLPYIGITHYVNGQHDTLEQLIRDYSLDFVQVNFSLANTNAERSLLSVALDQGVAVIINRPFQTGRIFDTVTGKSLPEWAPDIGCQSWAQFFLKYIISHPAVTCAIPATTQVAHVKENLAVGKGYLPDHKERKKMLEYYQNA